MEHKAFDLGRLHRHIFPDTEQAHQTAYESFLAWASVVAEEGAQGLLEEAYMEGFGDA